LIEFTTTVVVGADMVIIISSPPLSSTVLGFDIIRGPSFVGGSSLVFEIVTSFSSPWSKAVLGFGLLVAV
jgi:hypothetical protein